MTVRRILPGPPDVVYGVLADTNRWDRLLGWSPTHYSYELADPTDPTSRVRVGHATIGKREVRFVEEGEYWTGSFIFGERRFPARKGARISRGFFDLHVSPAGGQTSAELRVGITVERARAWLMVPFIYLRLWFLVRAYLRAVGRAVERGVGRGPAIDPEAPTATQARRVLIAAGAGEPHATGPSSRPSPATLSSRVAALAAAPVPDRLKRKIVEHLAGQPDEALVQILPFELARDWGEDKRDVLRTFLHATRAGLYDLEWQIDCPQCRVGADVSPHLTDLRRRVHCDECDVDFDVDFAENVHATFTANPALRTVPRVIYCASSPYFRPHVHGYLTIAPGETRELGPLPPGDILVRARGTSRSVVLRRRGDAGVAVAAGDGALGSVSETVPDKVIRLSNQGRFPARILVERAGWGAEIARGSLLLHMPDFVALFGTEAPAAGLPLSVGTVAVLFTDVVGSTEMYHRLGDARAYGLVQEHWRDAEAIATSHGGAIVKTMGDGVLASFPRLGDAVAAAVELMARTEALAERHGVAFSLRAGANEGPCFLVRAGDRLDLFGNTVNVAARLATAAGAQQLALLSEALHAPGVESVLIDDGCAIERVKKPIRGLPGQFSVVLATRPDAQVWSTGEHEPVARE